jgi:glycosyltransferase involved in cell wall biosynthesis
LVKEEIKMSSLPISVCIIAKNEEKYIEECLKRLKPYNMEIVVTDTGSTDRTKEIALKYADKVLDFAWINDFSAARNFCAENASNDWILVLDCDEYVSDIDTKALKNCLKAHYMNTGLLHLKSIVARTDGEKAYVTDDIPRLYNRKFYQFKDAVHENIVPKSGKYLPSFHIPMNATHHGYDITPDEMKVKQERNLTILKEQLAQKGASPYLCFQLAQSEMVLGDYETAIPYYETALSFGEPRSLTYIQSAIEGLAKAYVCADRRSDALALMECYESECTSARYVFFHANVLMDNKEPLKALVKYVKVTTLPDVTPECDELMYSYRHIIEIYHSFGEYDLAKFFEEKYAECLKVRENIQ